MSKKVQVIKATKDIKKPNNTDNKELMVSPYIRVSTDNEEQLGSYDSQIKYYTDLIQKTTGWTLGEIYADEGITGTQTKKRDDFKRMIRDALKGKVDMIITKSISRFARNTEDTLKYVRRLKEINVAVYFEKENINTLTMDGELLLTILSSLAQQESESISANVKMGLKMKMSRGEMVGSQECLGYDYNKETKELTINEKEAEIVRYIFNRYVEGAGGYVISKELTDNPNWYTMRGNKTWDATSVLRIIKNEKYVGDLLQGKTITLDPITHRKIVNMGESEQYLVKNHHEPIISRELFNKAHEILNLRSREVHKTIEKRNKYSRKHAFSSITKCGYCGSRTTRRRWHKGKPYEKFVWQCANYLENKKEACSESKGVDENLLEEAFIKSFNKLQDNDMSVIRKYIESFIEGLKDNDHAKELESVNREIKQLKNKIDKLVDMMLDGIIDRSVYEVKHNELSEELDSYRMARDELENANLGDATINKRVKELQDALKEHNTPMVDFNRSIFDKIIDEVVLGRYDDNGEFNPYTLEFKLKTGIEYIAEILFEDNQTGGKKPYVNCSVNTCSVINKHTILIFDFIYDFGYSIYRKNSTSPNGKSKVEVIVTI